MKSVQRFGVVGLACAATWLGLALGNERSVAQTAEAPVLMAQAGGAMSQQEINERLDVVPVFTIVSQDGTPVMANVDQNGERLQVASFWLDQNEALATIEIIREQNPEIADQARVVPLSLGYAIQIAQEQGGQEDVIFQVLPGARTLERAIAVVAATDGETITEFPGVPLFYGSSDQGVLTVDSGEAEVVPFFFDQADLQAALEQVGSDNPELVSQTRIEVTTLEQVIGSMLDPDANSDVDRIAFVPARSALEYVQSLPPDERQPNVDLP